MNTASHLNHVLEQIFVKDNIITMPKDLLSEETISETIPLNTDTAQRYMSIIPYYVSEGAGDIRIILKTIKDTSKLQWQIAPIRLTSFVRTHNETVIDSNMLKEFIEEYNFGEAGQFFYFGAIDMTIGNFNDMDVCHLICFEVPEPLWAKTKPISISANGDELVSCSGDEVFEMMMNGRITDPGVRITAMEFHNVIINFNERQQQNTPPPSKTEHRDPFAEAKAQTLEMFGGHNPFSKQ